MKYLVPVSMLFLLSGYLLKEEFFILNIYDTYFVISYLYPPICIAVLLNAVYFIHRLTGAKAEKIKTQ